MCDSMGCLGMLVMIHMSDTQNVMELSDTKTAKQ